MSWVAVGVGGASLVGGTLLNANAASSAASAQQSAAQRWMDFVKEQTGQAKDLVSSALTPGMLSSYGTALQAQEATVQRQESLAQSLEPALVSAGGQLAQLLNGQQAPTVKNIQDQRAQQRQQLVDQLNSSGVGANSSAGLQQLQRFDLDTENTVTNANQSYIQQLSGLSLSGMNGLASASGGANSTLNELSAADPTNKNKLEQAQTVEQSLGAMAGPEAAAVSAAGGQYAGQQIAGQGLQNLGKLGLGFAAARYGRSPGQTTPMTGTGQYSNTMQSAIDPNYLNPLSAGGGGTPTMNA